MKLAASIKSGKRKLCTYCNGNVVCSNFYFDKHKYRGREFWCKTCNAKYRYLKYRSEFMIISANYKSTSYEVNAEYASFAIGQRLQFDPVRDNFSITPCERNIGYTSWDYKNKIAINKKLDFPISKEELDEKISLYLTFS